MSFRLSHDAKDWFKGLFNKDPFVKTPNMDFYYLCLLVGLKYKKKEPIQNPDIVFIEYWPGVYKSSMYSILALFFQRELDNLKIDLSKRDEVKSQLKTLIDSRKPTGLTDFAAKQLDDYSYGGFLEIKSKLIEPPKDSSIFLQSISEKFLIIKKT